MPGKKTGLGKGLEALFADNDSVDSNNTLSLKLTDIEPNKGQPRKEFDENALAELADSIRQHGVIQPLLVRPLPNGVYQLVAGERRWRAARMAGLTEAPVVVKELTDLEAMEIALIENLQREDLNAIEEAEGFRTLMETYNLTQDEVAEKMGKSRPAVTNALRLLNLPKQVLAFVAAGELSAGHARAILGMEQESEMIKLAELAIKEKLSVREIEKRVKDSKRLPDAAPVKHLPRASFYDEIELAVAEETGRKVKVLNGKNDKGVITIEYYDKEDLRSLADIIARALD